MINGSGVVRTGVGHKEKVWRGERFVVRKADSAILVQLRLVNLILAIAQPNVACNNYLMQMGARKLGFLNPGMIRG